MEFVMDAGTGNHECRTSVAAATVLLLHGMPLWFAVTAAHAGTIYRCAGTHGAVAFRDTPCAAGKRQAKLDLTPQPLIDPHAPAPRRNRRLHGLRADRAPHRRAAHARRHKPVMSWECRASDGEVFYRHTRCPSTVRGDGIVRSEPDDGWKRRDHRRTSAWGWLSVHGRRVPRSVACSRIHAADAVTRDGHERDQRVSVYDHAVGRDPCIGH
jgi:Domain of unknown function (DUF4124)